MKIALISAYFGRWPVWFPAFLQSCRYNLEVTWLLFNDCETVYYPYDNVKFISLTLGQFRELAAQKFGFSLNFSSPYKTCDFKPAFGLIFEDYLQGYDFWGYCDIDAIFGDIRKFMTAELLEQYDIINPIEKYRLAGHFALFRNNHSVKTLFQQNPMYQLQFQKAKYTGYDEGKMKNLVARLTEAGEIKTYWPEQMLLNFTHPVDHGESHLPKYINRWYWERGKLYYRDTQEILYLHFMTWKKSLRKCYFTYEDDPTSFYISYSHIGDKYSLPPLKTVIETLKEPFAITKPYQLIKTFLSAKR